jgi:hypothetical protein
VPALKDGDGEAGACEVGSSCEAVVAAANDQRVPFLVLQRARSAAAEAPSPHHSKLSSLYAPPVEVQGYAYQHYSICNMCVFFNLIKMFSY